MLFQAVMQNNVQIYTLFKEKGVLFLGLFFVGVCFVWFFCEIGITKPSAVSPSPSLPH